MHLLNSLSAEMPRKLAMVRHQCCMILYWAVNIEQRTILHSTTRSSRTFRGHQRPGHISLETLNLVSRSKRLFTFPVHCGFFLQCAGELIADAVIDPMPIGSSRCSPNRKMSNLWLNVSSLRTISERTQFPNGQAGLKWLSMVCSLHLHRPFCSPTTS